MAARKPTIDDDPSEGVGFNMTPMIDVVFQLIIFLMLANDMSRKEIEDLNLPDAIHGQEDKGVDEKNRVIVNLLKNETGGPPTLKVKGLEMNLDQFQQFLQPIADSHREEEQPRASEVYVLIRADKGSRWQDVQWVMQACAHEKIKVYKMQFATTNPELTKQLYERK
jgi:biopolymer transport protein ExbD